MSNCCASHTPSPRLCSHTEQGADVAFQRHHLLSSFWGVQHHCFPVEDESKRTVVCVPQTSCQDGNCPFRVQLTDQLDGRTYCNALGKRSGVPLEPVSGTQAQLREHMEKAYHPMWVSFLGQRKLGRIGGGGTHLKFNAKRLRNGIHSHISTVYGEWKALCYTHGE